MAVAPEEQRDEEVNERESMFDYFDPPALLEEHTDEDHADLDRGMICHTGMTRSRSA